MQPDRFQSTVSRAGARDIDAGLRAHMQRVYNRMTVGVLFTGLISWFVSNSETLLQLFLGGPQAYIIMFAPLAVLWFGFRPDKMSSRTLMLSFGGICALYGISFSTIFLAYTDTSIARAFFMAAASFAALSIFGYTTKKNLDAIGSFLIMGMFGVLILGISNLFFQSDMLQNLVAGAGIVVFASLTAWTTQQTKEMYNPAHGDEMNSRMAWMSALNLYISFIALFQYILHFVGQRE